MTASEGLFTTGSQLPPRKSGIRSALEYTGIPTSWLTKRPKLPSRNWLIFLSITSSVAGLYIYDRQQCRRIRHEYIERVAHLAEQPVGSLDWPRRVIVYGCKWPGDEDYDRNLKYFRKYVKPILVAAAVDFEQISNERHGDLANRIADGIKARRRLASGLDPPPQVSPIRWMSKSPEETWKHELDGGIVIVGRHTLKEFLAGLKSGWTNSLEKVDKDEMLARELEADGNFDEPEERSAEVVIEGEDNLASSHLPSPQNSVVNSPPQTSHQYPHQNQPPSTILASLKTLPAVIPVQPPLLLVPFTNYIGFVQIPIMIWDFFNQRYKVRSGAETAYKLIMKNTRPFVGPSYPPFSSLPDSIAPLQLTEDTDLNFDQKAETFYKKSTKTIPADIDKARKKYYESLPAKLETARAISRGIRERTKDEVEHPPPTEVELRAERMKKERRWRNDLEGWEIVKPEEDAVWDERFADALRVFDDPYPGVQRSE